MLQVFLASVPLGASRRRRQRRGHAEFDVRRHCISPTTVWRGREGWTTDDKAMGPAEPHLTTLSLEQGAASAAFRPHALVPPDDSSVPWGAIRERYEHDGLGRLRAHLEVSLDACDHPSRPKS